MATYDLAYPGAAIDAILNTAYFLQEAGYIFQGSASEYSGTPSKRVWLIAPAGSTGFGLSSAVPQGSFGICLYNGTSWVGKIINVATIDSTPTQNSGNAVSSGGVYAAINQLSASVTEALENLTFTDTTPSAFQDEYINMKVSTTEGGVERILTYLTILAATTSKAGLLSAADKVKIDSFLTGIRSMQFVDATSSSEQAIKLVEQLKWTVGGVQEVIDSITLLAATSSKAGLLSASDKAYIDALPATLTNLSNSISGALALMQSLVGYYVCDTAAGTAAKTVAATGYSLTNGGCIRIKMTNANTADNATLNINSTGAKALYYDGTQASSTNTWEAGEVLEVYYDGTQYQCASGGGGKFKTGEKVEDVSIVETVTPYGIGLPTSGAVYDEFPSNIEESGDFDLVISDEDGNVLVVFENGHVKTKNFDSSQMGDDPIEITDYNEGDFVIADENDNALVVFRNGNIFVKNFSSAPLAGKKCSFLGDSITTFGSYPGSYNPFYNGSNAGVTNVNSTWWKSLCDRQGATVNRIYAYGGADLVNNLCLQYGNLFSEGTTGTSPDVIFILAGINDWYHAKSLGTIADAENSNTTFYAAYKYLLKNLKETYPNAQIIGLTMLNSMINGTVIPYINSNDVSIRDFCKAVIDCCDYYSVPCFDLNKIVNINGLNYTDILADNTHPNILGIRMMTNAIMNNIRNLIYY